MRQIILDTETTGLDPSQGHRIIEIGCVELVNRRLTGNRYHRYLQPDREIDAGAVEVHGITNDFLADKPRFHELADEFFEFIKGAELIIHNAAFDLGFLNHELARAGVHYGRVQDHCAVLDTLMLARQRHPGQSNSLDALCRRYSVDNSHRDLHGALLDAEILAELYLAMTGGQVTLLLDGAASGIVMRSPLPQLDPHRPRLKVIRASQPELAAHEQRLTALDKESGGQCVWRRISQAEA